MHYFVIECIYAFFLNNSERILFLVFTFYSKLFNSVSHFIYFCLRYSNHVVFLMKGVYLDERDVLQYTKDLTEFNIT